MIQLIFNIGLIIVSYCLIFFVIKSVSNRTKKNIAKKSKLINFALISRIILLLYIIMYFIFLHSAPKITSFSYAGIIIAFAIAPTLISFSTDIWKSFRLLIISLVLGFGIALIVGLSNILSDTPDAIYCKVATFCTIISGICSLFYIGNNFLSFDIDWSDSFLHTDPENPNGAIKAEKNVFGNTIYKNSKGEVVAKGEENIFGDEVIKNKDGNVVARENNTIFGKSYVNKNNEVIGKFESNILIGDKIKDKDGNTKYEVEEDLSGDNVYHKKK